jgi:uncharacterized membrane protein
VFKKGWQARLEQSDMRRYHSIDILRGLAIVLMIQVHFVENLSPRDGSATWLYDISGILGSFPAPLFTFVSGLSYGLWLRKQESLGRSDEEITKITLRRGLFLFGTGIAFNFFIWLPEDTFNWDILTLIGTSLLFLAFARKLPPPILALACAMVLLASPVWRVVGDYSTYWVGKAYAYDFTLRDILFGFVANGYFPVFPWIIFPLMGFIAEGLIFQRQQPRDAAPGWLSVAGIGLVALSGISVAVGAYFHSLIAEHYPDGLTGLLSLIAKYYADGFSEFPASTAYVLGMSGFCLLGLMLLNRWLDQRDEIAATGPIITIFKRYSVFSLTVYVVHHMVILWPLWIAAAWDGQEDLTGYWRQAMTTPQAFGLAMVFLIVCYFLLVLLERHPKFALESVMRWLCD